MKDLRTDLQKSDAGENTKAASNPEIRIVNLKP
jgi:hypothetical protein